MSTLGFIQDLVELLFRLDRGMLEFDAPPPEQAKEGISRAVNAFGEQAPPALHQRFAELPAEDGPVVLDVLGEIASADSAPYIIDFHKHYADFLSGAAAISALRKLKADTGYAYLRNLLIRISRGDKKAFNTKLEFIIACQALAEWQNSVAVEPLKEAIHVVEAQGGAPEAVVQALARYPQKHQFLQTLGISKPSLQAMISQTLSQLHGE